MESSAETVTEEPKQSKRKVTFLSNPSMATSKSHPFSHHDNRHTIHHFGEYFGQGLGKRKMCNSARNQHSSTDLISWRDSSQKPIADSQSSISLGDQEALLRKAAADTSQPETMQKFHVLTKSSFRRFPHRHCLPSEEHWRLPTQTSSWFENSYVTPLHILAATQLPFAKKSSWNYSYKFQ